MVNYLTLGPVPANENCTPVGGSEKKARKENRIYKEQLEDEFKHFKNIKFDIKAFPHEFGTYTEVCVEWLNDEGINEAFNVEETSNPDWTQESLEKLAL